jgi:hypothetical protein
VEYLPHVGVDNDRFPSFEGVQFHVRREAVVAKDADILREGILESKLRVSVSCVDTRVGVRESASEEVDTHM